MAVSVEANYQTS